MAQCFADALRQRFPDVLPTADGHRHESRARGAQGVKKLDVNASTPEYGLALGLSIKTLNFPDSKTSRSGVTTSGRYTKNLGRIATELRAEAMDYHVRQPFAVMAAFVFLPIESCDDGGREASSFGKAVKTYRPYSGRAGFADNPQAFEQFFVALYALDENERCTSVEFFDVQDPPPRTRRPRKDETCDFDSVIRKVLAAFDMRNEPPFEWAPD